jgi:hypothetical protein
MERKEVVELSPRVINSLIHQKITEDDIDKAKALCKPVNDRMPPRGKRKLPTYGEALMMTIHARTCKHQKCKIVWRGAWGSFIGGS